MDQISLDQSVPPQQLQLGGSPPPPSEAVASSRAAKFEMGVGIPYADTYKQILDGEEQSLRQVAASQIDQQSIQARNANIRELAIQRGHDLNMNEVRNYLNSGSVNPDSVMERTYGPSFVDAIQDYAKRNPDSQFVTETNPDVLAQAKGAGDVLSRREYMLTNVQNIQDDVDKDSWFKIPFVKTPLTPEGTVDVGSRTAPFSSALNWATLGIYGGLREEYLTRGNTPDTSMLSGIFEGSNINAQAKELLQSPTFEEFKDKFDRGFQRLREQDPSLAQQWAAGIIGMSVDDTIGRNAMSAINLAGGFAAGKAIKTGLKGIGEITTRRLGRATPEAAGEVFNPTAGMETPELWASRDALNTLHDVVKAAPASPTKANVMEAVGDTAEAAVQKSIQSFAHPNPEKDAIDTLFAMHRADQAAIASAPGNLSREEHTRILNMGEGYEKDAIDTLTDTTRIVDLPQLAENGFRDIADDGKKYFKGKANTIVDIDVVHDNLTGKQHYVYTIGNYDGRPFESAQAAQIHAEVNGYGNPNIIGKDPDIVYLPQSAVLKEKLSAEQTRGAGGKFGPKGEISSEAKPVYEPNPNFIHKKDESGYRFYLGHPDGTEIEVSPRILPEPTDIPFNLRDGKFGNPLPVGPQIQPRGVGYHIKWTIPVDATDDNVLDKIIGSRTESATTEARNSLWSKLVNGTLGYFRLPADTLSAAEDENRGKVVYAQNRYLKHLAGQMKYVEDLYHGLLDDGNVVKRKSLSYLGNLTGRNRQVWNDLVRALTASQTMEDPITKLPGYYMKTPAEINAFWQRTFQRPASAPEMMAYRAMANIDYSDWVYRNIADISNKFRLGIMSHTLNDMVDGEKSIAGSFNGRFVKKIPEGNKVVLIHEGDGKLKLYNNLNTEAKKFYREEFGSGRYRAIQLHDPDAYPIKFNDKEGNNIRIGYVLSKNVDSKPLSYQQVGYRGGGHWDYATDRFIKQPIMRKQIVNGQTHWVYSGDATFSTVGNGMDAKTITNRLSEIRKLLRDKKVAEAKALHQSTFDQPWKDFVKGFYPRKNRATGEIEPSRFNLHEDFRTVPKGTTIAQYDKSLIAKYKRLPSEFIDATKEQSLARNFQVEFTGTRDSHDLFEPYNDGTVQNPLYKFKPAELIDPITTMHRSTNRIVNSLLMDNYKNSAVTHWLEENMHLLDEDPKQVRSSPFYYFMNSKFKRNVGLEGQIAKSNQYKIRKLVGMPSMMDSWLHDMKQSIADELFNTDSKVKRAILIPPSWMLHRISSPTNLVRGLAFHENLGLFNWAQLAAQNMGWVNVFAMSPEHATQAMFASWMHIWSRVNMSPRFLNHLDRMAGTFGWRPGEWQDAMKAYQRSGFDQLGNSLVVDNPNKQNFMLGAGKRLIRNGTIFFDLAEQNVRHGSWYAAYHEFTRAFPDAKIDDIAIGKILRRAKTIYMNMGRDSKTMLNTGLTSMPLQFYKYIENVGQTFLSKRIGDIPGKENTMMLRAEQRAKMILMYSLAFGPAGATGLSMLPFSDWIREHELKQGYVPGNNFLQTLLMEGPLSMAGAYASGWWRTGQADMSKGTFYNYNNRYGANGYQLIRDLLEGSPNFWKIAMGASGSAMYNTMQSLSPFVYAMSSSFNDEKDAPFSVTIDDWKELARNANSFRYGERLVKALQFGKWLDRHGRNITDVGSIDAVLRTLLGTNDVKIDDAYLKGLIKQEEKNDYTAVEKDYQRYRRLAEQSAQNKDPEQAKVYNRNAIFLLQHNNVPPEVVAKIFAHDASLNKNSLDVTNWSFYKQYVPLDRQGAAQKAFEQTNKAEH